MFKKIAPIFILLLVVGAYAAAMVMLSASLPEKVALAIVVPLIGLVVYTARKIIAIILSSFGDDKNKA